MEDYCMDLRAVPLLVFVVSTMGLAMEKSGNQFVPPHRRAGFIQSNINTEEIKNRSSKINSSYLQGKTTEQLLGDFIWKASQGKLRSSDIDAYMAAGVDINGAKNGRSVLHWVASNAADDEECVRLRGTLVKLLSIPKIDVDITDADGKTPLQWAAGQGNYGAVKVLLLKNANPNKVDKAGATALHWAAHNGHAHIVDFLISKGALIEAKDKAAITPLSRAVKQNHVSVVEKILSYYVNDPEKKAHVLNMRDFAGSLAFHWVSSPEMARLLIKEGVDVNSVSTEDGTTLLHRAAMNKNIPLIKELIALGADVNKQDTYHLRTPLQAAVRLHYGSKRYDNKSLRLSTQELIEIIHALATAKDLNCGICDDHGKNALFYISDKTSFNDQKEKQQLIEALTREQ